MSRKIAAAAVRHSSNSIDLLIVVGGAVAIIYLFAQNRNWDEAAQAGLVISLGFLGLVWRVKHGGGRKQSNSEQV